MDLPNLGPYVSVVGEAQSPRRLVYRRGYGNVVATLVGQYKIGTDVSQYNRLQPLSGEFGKHNPVTADTGFVQYDSQSTIAWDTKQPVPATSYQNELINRIPSVDSTMPGSG